MIGVDPGDRVGEVGVDLDPLDVGDDQEGRVLEGLGVEFELPVRFVEILARFLVLPAEVAAVPDVGETTPAAGFAEPLLEGEEAPLGVHLGRRRVTDQAAEVDEVGLGSSAFGQGGGAPGGLEFGDVHGANCTGSAGIGWSVDNWANRADAVNRHL